MKKTGFFGLSAAALLVPAIALAQNFTYVNNFASQGVYYLRMAVTVIMILMTLYFLISVFQFIREKDATKIKDRRKTMINGLIGLFVAVGVWGIIAIAGRVFDVDTSGNTTAPGVTCPPGTIYNATTHLCN